MVRLPHNTHYWCWLATLLATAMPGQANTQGLPLVPAPVFSHAPGFYGAPFALTLTVGEPDALITYTLDGSEPTLQSTPYTGPLALTSRADDPNTISLIPTNMRQNDHYSWRPPRTVIFKLNVVRARAFLPDHAPSAVVTRTYVVDPNPDQRFPLPVISLVTAPEHLFDHETGIYVPGAFYEDGDHWTGNYFQTGDAWERPVHLEFFDRQGTLLLAQDAGLRIHGGWSKHFPQKALRLYARAEYGAATFAYPLFPGLPDASYKRFLIRNSGNDWGLCGFRDLLVQTAMGGMGFDTQAGQPVVHYLNGEYWGLANLRERYDRFYLERCYDVPPDEVALLADDAVLEEGTDADRTDYVMLRSFIATQDMTLPANIIHVAERMDLANFIAYQIAEIYSANHDWPGNNVRYWRRTRPAYDPGAPYGHDGRWRWMMFDVDDGFFHPTRNTLALATAASSPGYPNPPWSTLLLRRLLLNEQVRLAFINTFADHLNSTFAPIRLIGLLEDMTALYQPAIGAWQDRYDVTYPWHVGVFSLSAFITQRPQIQRQHLVDHFSLAGTTSVTLDVNDDALGKLRLNQLEIDAALPGLADPSQPYPWSGTYFQGVPITVTALPSPGHRLIAWLDRDESDSVLVLVPGTEPLHLRAVFARDLSLPVPLHVWHFNNLPEGVLAEVPADLSRFGAGMATYPGTGNGYLDRVDPGTELGALPDTPAGFALRARNPASTRELVLAVPSPYHHELTFQYAASRTVNGAQTHSLYAQTHPLGAWLPLAVDVAVTEAWQLYTVDLADVDGVNDNPHLRLKFTFGGSNAAGTSGNQRFDNITLGGTQIPGANLPPVVVQPIALQHAIELGNPLVLELDGLFADPEDDPLTYLATSDLPTFAQVSLDGSTLTITPLLRGDARITVTASDGHHAPVAHTFGVLLHPAAAVLAGAPYTFTTWNPDLPERTYPAHMLFLQSDVDDPGLEQPLLYPYYIPHDDYHADDQATIGFPYNNTGRTRINGLGDQGIALVNTGRGRDLGGALLAIDTRGTSTVTVAWLGGTVAPNERVYAIRLQYRTTLNGPFSDVLSGGQPIQYVRSEVPGDVVALGPAILPPALLEQPYVQLLWRYHHVSGESGPRAQLRLDEVTVANALPSAVEEPALPLVTTLVGNAPNPFNPSTVISFSVREGEAGRLEVYNSRGQRVRQLGAYPAGRHEAVWNGTDDRGLRCASGVYFYRLTSPSHSQTRKMLMVK